MPQDLEHEDSWGLVDHNQINNISEFTQVRYPSSLVSLLPVPYFGNAIE